MSNNKSLTSTPGEDTNEFRVKPIFAWLVSSILFITTVISLLKGVRYHWLNIHEIERASEVMEGHYDTIPILARMSNVVSIEALGTDLAAEVKAASIDNFNQLINQESLLANDLNNNPNSSQLNSNGDVINGVNELIQSSSKINDANSQPNINKYSLSSNNNDSTDIQSQTNDELKCFNNPHNNKKILINSTTNNKSQESNNTLRELTTNSDHLNKSKSNQSLLKGDAPNLNTYKNTKIYHKTTDDSSDIVSSAADAGNLLLVSMDRSGNDRNNHRSRKESENVIEKRNNTKPIKSKRKKRKRKEIEDENEPPTNETMFDVRDIKENPRKRLCVSNQTQQCVIGNVLWHVKPNSYVNNKNKIILRGSTKKEVAFKLSIIEEQTMIYDISIIKSAEYKQNIDVVFDELHDEYLLKGYDIIIPLAQQSRARANKLIIHDLIDGPSEDFIGEENRIYLQWKLDILSIKASQMRFYNGLGEQIAAKLYN